LPQKEKKKMKKKNNEEYEYVPKPKVYCDGCKDFHFGEDVIFQEIMEDYLGRDVVTFECKTDGEFHKGIVIIS